MRHVSHTRIGKETNVQPVKDRHLVVTEKSGIIYMKRGLAKEYRLLDPGKVPCL